MAKGLSGEKVKIIRVITRLNIGGPALHTLLLTEGIDDGRYESFLVSGRPDPEEGNMLDLKGRDSFQVHEIPELKRRIHLKDDWISFWKLFRLFRKEKPQIVHTHMAKAGTLGRLAAVCAGVPVRVHTYHGHVFHNYFSRPTTYIFLLIERILARASDCLIAVSQEVKDDLCHRYRIGVPEKVRVIPLGLDIEPFLACEANRGFLRRELGLDDSVLLVGIVGRLVPIKDHRFFLSVAFEISRRRDDTRFVVVGDGELRKELENEVQRLGLVERIIFLGWRKELERVYPDLDVVVLTSKNEGTPVSLIEAMACARPAVSTEVGGTPDVVQEGWTGYLVAPGDKGLFCRRVETLLDDAETRRLLGQRGREWVRQRYAKKRLVLDTQRLYEELVENKRSKRIETQ